MFCFKICHIDRTIILSLMQLRKRKADIGKVCLSPICLKAGHTFPLWGRLLLTYQERKSPFITRDVYNAKISLQKQNLTKWPLPSISPSIYIPSHNLLFLEAQPSFILLPFYLSTIYHPLRWYIRSLPDPLTPN